jgi:CRP-like cAMP-binding protein
VRKRVKTEVFAELSDPVLFPRLSDAEIEQLAERGERRTFETNELLFEQGMRDAPFFVIEHGTVDILDRRPQEDVWFARMDGGTFIGDVSMFTGEPTIAAGVAVEPTSVIAFARPELREMLAELPEFGELVLQTMTARRAWLERNEVGVLRLIASRRSGPPSRSATSSSGTCCRCAGTTSTRTPRVRRCWRRLPFRAPRRLS